MLHKAENIYYLVLYRESLLTLGLRGCPKANCSHELGVCALREIPAPLQGGTILDILQSQESRLRLQEMLPGAQMYGLNERSPPGIALIKMIKRGGPWWEGLEFLWERVSQASETEQELTEKAGLSGSLLEDNAVKRGRGDAFRLRWLQSLTMRREPDWGYLSLFLPPSAPSARKARVCYYRPTLRDLCGVCESSLQNSPGPADPWRRGCQRFVLLV